MTNCMMNRMCIWFAEMTHLFVEPTFIAKLSHFGHGLNNRHLADCIFKYISLYEDSNVFILISLKFVYNGAICNMLPSVQIVVSHQTGSSHYLNQYWPKFYGPLCRRSWAPNESTDFPLVTHIYIYIYIYASVNRISIGSDNGLSPIQCPIIILTNAKLLSIGPQEQF